MAKITLDLRDLYLEQGEYEVSWICSEVVPSGYLRETFTTLCGKRVYYYYKPSLRNNAHMLTVKMLSERGEYKVVAQVVKYKLVRMLYLDKLSRTEQLRRRLCQKLSSHA